MNCISPISRARILCVSSNGGLTKKFITYVIDTLVGSITFQVTVPYHHDDREADRMGREQLRADLMAATLAA